MIVYHLVHQLIINEHVLPRFQLGSLDSKSKVLGMEPREPACCTHLLFFKNTGGFLLIMVVKLRRREILEKGYF